MKYYRYEILRSDDLPDANEYNNQLLGPATLGIEVTKKDQALRCGLGNIDPQHGGEFKSSAVEDALAHPLPPEGTLFVTNRLDRDAVATMAVFDLRRQGKQINKPLVVWVGALDRDSGGNVILTNPELRVSGPAATAMQVIILDPLNMWPTMEEKVEATAKILADEMSYEEMKSIAVLKQKNTDGFQVEMHGPVVAYVFAPKSYDWARNWVNARYDVGVVFDPEYTPKQPGGNAKPYARWTIVRRDGHFDRQLFVDKINAEEARARDMTLAELEARGYSWGGNKNIVSSPFGRETRPEKETILRIVRECAESGVVS